MTVVVLTGASGYLGQHTLQGLLSLSVAGSLHIHALHNSKPELELAVSSLLKQRNEQSTSSTNILRTVTVTGLDLTNEQDVDDWMERTFISSSEERGEANNDDKLLIDFCIHTAAMSSPGVCEKEPDHADAINVPRHFLKCMYKNNPQITMIGLSTDQVYDGNTSEKYRETDPVGPCNIYGKTKVALEQYLLNDMQKNQFPQSNTILLRSSILLGPLAPFLPDAAHGTFLQFCASRDAPTTFWTDEIRSVISVHDVVDNILIPRVVDVAKNQQQEPKNHLLASGIYNMGGPHPVNRHDMAKLTLERVGKDASKLAVPALKASQPPTPSVAKSPLDISMDSNKLVQALGNPKFRTLSEMVQETFSIR